jgi:hypothetical protein
MMVKREKHLETILSIVLGLAGIYWATKNRYLPPAIVVVSAVGLFSPYLTEKTHWVWMKFSHVMGSIMSKVILSIVFYVFLLPIAYLSKRFSKKDPLQLKKSTESSYYTTRNHRFTGEDLEDPW